MRKLAPPSKKPNLYVSNMNAPYDLRPAVSTIRAGKNWLLDRMDPGQPLVILMGRIHHYQTHSLLQQAVLLDNLEQGEEIPFAFGTELDPVFACHLRGRDQHIKALHDTCEEFDIAMAYNDAVRVDNYGQSDDKLIDVNDPINIAHAQEHGFDLETMDLSFISNDGMTFRNTLIVDNAMEHIKETGARIYIQDCGIRHVFGGKRREDDIEASYPESLTALFLEKGAGVLPVMMDSDNTYLSLERNHVEIPIPNAVRARAVRINGLFSGINTIPYMNVRALINNASEMNLR